MFSFEEYQMLEEDVQTQVLSLDGVYLELIHNDQRINKELYALYHFYVEVLFDRDTDEPICLRAFADTDELQPYLELLDIAEVMSIKEGN